MSTPINLNKVRKARAKEARRIVADENAAKFGRSKSEKERDEAQADKTRRHIDGHKREP